MIPNIEYATYQEWIEVMVQDTRLGALEIGIAVTATTYGDASNMELVDYCQAGKRAVLAAKKNLRDFGYVEISVGVGRGNRTKISAAMPDGRLVLNDDETHLDSGAYENQIPQESGADAHRLTVEIPENKVVLKRPQSGSKVVPKCPQSGADAHHNDNSNEPPLYTGLYNKPPIVPLEQTDESQVSKSDNQSGEQTELLTNTIDDDATKAPPSKTDPIPDQFEVWWKLYPCKPSRKQSKGECLKLFRLVVEGRRTKDSSRRKKVEDHVRATADELVNAVRNFAASKPDPEYTMAPKTWLNGGGWLDDVCQSIKNKTPWFEDEGKYKTISDERWEAQMREHANGIWPRDKLGYAPEHPKCVAPKHIIEKLGLEGIYDINGVKKL